MKAALLRWWFLLLVPAVPLLQRELDQQRGAFAVQEESLYVWSGSRIKRMAPGFENVLADVYWLRTVQYFGGERLFSANKRFELLRPLIAITTTLDPHLEIAYRYGAIFLAEPRPVGAGRPDDAVAVLQGGIDQNPGSWQLHWTLGYFLFQFKEDSKRASDVLLQGASLPGAPEWLKTLAADFLSRGGERATSRRLWQRILEQSEPGAMHDNAARHLLYLDAEDVLDVVQKAVQDFQHRTGRYPSALGDLPGAGGQVLKDPAGVPFRYDAGTGRVEIERSSTAWRPR